MLAAEHLSLFKCHYSEDCDNGKFWRERVDAISFRAPPELRTNNSMEQNPYWEADSYSAIQIPLLLWNPKSHYRVHRSPPLSQILTPYFFASTIFLHLRTKWWYIFMHIFNLQVVLTPNETLRFFCIIHKCRTESIEMLEISKRSNFTSNTHGFSS